MRRSQVCHRSQWGGGDPSSVTCVNEFDRMCHPAGVDMPMPNVSQWSGEQTGPYGTVRWTVREAACKCCSEQQRSHFDVIVELLNREGHGPCLGFRADTLYTLEASNCPSRTHWDSCPYPQGSQKATQWRAELYGFGPNVAVWPMEAGPFRCSWHGMKPFEAIEDHKLPRCFHGLDGHRCPEFLCVFWGTRGLQNKPPFIIYRIRKVLRRVYLSASFEWTDGSVVRFCSKSALSVILLGEEVGRGRNCLDRMQLKQRFSFD